MGTSVALILDRILSAGIEYERQQTISLHATNKAASQQHAERRYSLQVAQRKIRRQYQLVK